MERWKSVLEKRKKEDTQYLFELQKFLDIASNVGDAGLKQRLVCQMLKCNERTIELIEEILNE